MAVRSDTWYNIERRSVALKRRRSLQLRVAFQEKFPCADPELFHHTVPLVAALDIAMVFARSFGAAKFQLAQHRVTLGSLRHSMCF